MTRASNERPVSRVLTSQLGDEYVVTLHRSTVSVRPIRTRSTKVRLSLEIGGLFLRTLSNQLDAEKRAKRRGRRS